MVQRMFLSILVLFFAVSTVALAAEKNDQEGWKELFNGKDLSGWQPNIGKDSFSVENGLLRAQGIDKSSHLFYIGDDGKDDIFKNFELVAVARSEPGSNSGIFIHTSRTLKNKWKRPGFSRLLKNGYEVQLNNAMHSEVKTGSLYDVVDITKNIIDETKWFEIRIKVLEKRIQIFLNDERVLDYTEPEKPNRPKWRSGRVLNPKGGAIALQAHDSKSIYYFKSIKIRKLKGNIN